MKKVLIIISMIAVFAPAVYPQKNLNGVYVKSEKEQIAGIEKMKQVIVDKLDSYTKIEKYKDSISSKYYFFQDKELKLVVLKTIDNKLEKRVSWYFANGQLIFSEQIWIDDKTNRIINHEQFYTHSGHLIAWIKTDNTKEDTSSTGFKYIDKNLGAYAEELIAAAQK